MPSEYIRTSTNFISRKAQIYGPQRVEMRGRSVTQDDVTLRGDLAAIRIGRYSLLDEGCTLTPCMVVQNNVTSYVPMTIGSQTRVGRNCAVEAAYIGSNVEIGTDCIISSRCIVKDCVRVMDGTVLAPDAVIPPFALVAGKPGRIIGELPPSTPVSRRQSAVAEYRSIKKSV